MGTPFFGTFDAVRFGQFIRKYPCRPSKQQNCILKNYIKVTNFRGGNNASESGDRVNIGANEGEMERK